MPLQEPSPYEVLGVPPTADTQEINVAVTSATKAGRYARQQIQQSSAMLRDPVRRLEIDLEQPLPPEPVDGVLDLLAPLVDEPLLVVDRPRPTVPELVALHRAELEADFEEPPAIAVGDEPRIPVRFNPGMSVLPHIEFPA